MRITDIKGIFKKNYLAGLDIGSSSVKLARFIEKRDGLHLVRVDLREIRYTADQPADEEKIVRALEDLFRGIDIGKTRIIAAINCPQTAVKKINTPYIPKAELNEGIRLEAKNYFPFSVEESLLDFEILRDFTEKGARKYEVLVAVCPVETVDKYLSLLIRAGIKPASFVSSAYALQKLAQAVGRKGKEGKTVCFVDIGRFNTELIILKGESLMFSRRIPVAGSDFTRAMTGALVSDRGRLQLSWEEAEKIKREVGIPAGSESGIIDGKVSPAQILSLLRASLEQLSGEIERCFDYYGGEAGGSKVDSLVLFGGGSCLRGLAKFLSEALGLEVTLGDSLSGFKAERDAAGQISGISRRLDLALGAALNAAKGINLLPPEIKEKTKRVFKRGVIEGTVTAIIFASLLTFIGMRIQLNIFRKRIAVAELELSSLQPQLDRIKAESLAEKVLAGEPYWEDIFKELSNRISANIQLTNFALRNKVLTIKGTVESKDGQQVLADFMLTLEKGLFSNVKLVESKGLSGRLGIEFELSCWVDYEK
jgi:type IV pilus assembly protein PilM